MIQLLEEEADNLKKEKDLDDFFLVAY